MKILQHMVQLFYPRLCTSCLEELLPEEKFLCLSCRASLPETNFHRIKNNMAMERLSGPWSLTNASAHFYFNKDSVVQDMLHAMKYKGDRKLILYMAEEYAGILQSAGWFEDIDVLVPVPLASRKEEERGYNQSRYIAEGVQRVTGIPVSSKIMMRTRNTASQTHMTPDERKENVAGAFKADEAELQKYRHVLLIDDVITTGATARACMQEMKDKGMSKFSFLSLAIAIES